MISPLSPPEAHLPSDLLAAYASGDAPEVDALVAACHLTFCARCRDVVTEHEAVGGKRLDASASEPVGAQVWAALAERLTAEPAPSSSSPGLAPNIEGWTLPRPLAAALGAPPLRFKRLPRGLRTLSVPLSAASRSAGHRARLFLFPPGYRLPAHHHVGPEHAVVLAGGFTDAQGHYARGDVSTPAPGVRHAPRVDDDGPCLALVVNQGPVRPTSPWLRLWLRLARWSRARRTAAT